MRGRFTARAFEWEWAVSSNGTDYILVKFALDSGEHVYWRGFFSEKTRDRTAESLRHCGWDGVDLERLEGLGTKDAELVLEEEEYKGEVRTQVKWVNAIGGGAMKVKGSMSGEDRRRFFARMNALVSKPASPAAKKPADDDGIPF